MMLQRCVILLLVFILSILEAAGASYHGYNSYYEYYKYYVNRMTMKITLKMSEQGNYKGDNVIVKHVDGNIQKSQKDNSNQAGSKKAFVFPDDDRLRNDKSSYVETRINVNTPRCDNGQSFCENVQDYPQELVDRILEENPNLYAYATEDAVSINPRLDDEKDLFCSSSERIITPRKARSTNDDWVFIIQSEKKNFKQRLRVEICSKANHTCEIIDALPNGYYSSCTQKYVSRQILGVENGTEIVTDIFLPANCCCHLYFRPN